MQNYFKEERKKGRGRKKEGKERKRKRKEGRKKGREKMREKKEASLLHAWATVRYSAPGLVIFPVFIT